MFETTPRARARAEAHAFGPVFPLLHGVVLVDGRDASENRQLSENCRVEPTRIGLYDVVYKQQEWNLLGHNRNTGIEWGCNGDVSSFSERLKVHALLNLPVNLFDGAIQVWKSEFDHVWPPIPSCLVPVGSGVHIGHNTVSEKIASIPGPPGCANSDLEVHTIPKQATTKTRPKYTGGFCDSVFELEALVQEMSVLCNDKPTFGRWFSYHHYKSWCWRWFMIGCPTSIIVITTGIKHYNQTLIQTWNRLKYSW